MIEDTVLISDDSVMESDRAKELAGLKLMLGKQDAKMEKLRPQLAATEIKKRKEDDMPTRLPNLIVVPAAHLRWKVGSDSVRRRHTSSNVPTYSFGYHPGCSPTSPVTSCAFVG